MNQKYETITSSTESSASLWFRRQSFLILKNSSYSKKFSPSKKKNSNKCFSDTL